MPDRTYIEFMQKLRENGYFYAPSEGTKLFEIAKKCGMTIGLATGGSAGVMMSGVGAFTIPGFGSVPGYVVGFLAGMFSGTVVCTMGHWNVKQELDKLIQR